MGDAAELRKLAEWYRAFSAVGRTDEREGRLRLAEYLDAKADDELEQRAAGPANI
jgi:hypothetical protein